MLELRKGLRKRRSSVFAVAFVNRLLSKETLPLGRRRTVLALQTNSFGVTNINCFRAIGDAQKHRLGFHRYLS